MACTNKRDTFAGRPAEAATAKKVARNTWRYTRADGAQCVRLHNTDVVVEKDGQTTFNSGGWRTITTKDRIGYNRSGYRIHSNKGRWYVTGNGVDCPYFDGMTLPRDAEKSAKAEKVVAAETKTLKLIDGYLAKVKKLDTMPMPENGDCWLCLMFNQGQKPHAPCHDPQHLRDHLREGYVHGALIVSALRWAGVPEAGLAFWIQHVGKKRIVPVLRRFLKAQLGVGAV